LGRDKVVIHVEPVSYFKVLTGFTEETDRFFEYLINDVARPYLETVFETFFKDSIKLHENDDIVNNFIELNLKIE